MKEGTRNSKCSNRTHSEYQNNMRTTPSPPIFLPSLILIFFSFFLPITIPLNSYYNNQVLPKQTWKYFWTWYPAFSFTCLTFGSRGNPQWAREFFEQVCAGYIITENGGLKKETWRIGLKSDRKWCDEHSNESDGSERMRKGEGLKQTDISVV